MKFLKIFGNFLLSFIFRFSLFFGLSTLSAVLILTNPETPKEILVNINAYQRFTDSVIESSVSSPNSNTASIPVDEPQIKKVIASSLNESSLKSISDSTVDSIYEWLNGKDPKPDFAIDLSQNKQILAEGVADYAVKRIDTLEPCIIPPVETSVFEISCLPEGTDVAQLRNQIVNDITNDNTVFSNEKITYKDLPKTSNGQNIVDVYSDAPAYFQLFKIAPFVLLGLSLVCALIVIFTSRTKRAGVKKVGSTLLGTAVIMAITPLIYVYVLPSLGFKAPSLGGNSESVSAIINDFTTELYSSFNVMLLNVALQTAVVGVVVLMITRFIKQHSSIYMDIEKKSGLSVSEAKNRKVSDRVMATKPPVQTSEGAKKKSKKNESLAKKYKKL